MVKYYGRARQRTGSVNTNQLGLKMSGCPSGTGHSIAIRNYIRRRVSCLRGMCGNPKQNGKLWNESIRNENPYCVTASNK